MDWEAGRARAGAEAASADLVCFWKMFSARTMVRSDWLIFPVTSASCSAPLCRDVTVMYWKEKQILWISPLSKSAQAPATPDGNICGSKPISDSTLPLRQMDLNRPDSRFPKANAWVFSSAASPW